MAPGSILLVIETLEMFIFFTFALTSQAKNGLFTFLHILKMILPVFIAAVSVYVCLPLNYKLLESRDSIAYELMKKF